MDFGTDIITLPSEGYFYPKDNPLSSGSIEVKYLSGKHEEILSNKNLINRKLSVDIVLKDIIVDKNINYEDILVMDKEAIILASKILSYGHTQEYSITCTKCEEKTTTKINLLSFESNQFNFNSIPNTFFAVSVCISRFLLNASIKFSSPEK